MVFSHYWPPRATLGLSEEAIFSFSVIGSPRVLIKNADSWVLATEIWLPED